MGSAGRHGSPISILTSGIGLGVYIPALLIQRQMRARGASVEVETLEGYYTSDGQRRHLAHKDAYHRNFDLALMAHRMARSVEGSLDGPRLSALLDRWAGERRRHFIVWSGFWLPVLERYRARLDDRLEIDCCRIDAVVSASFRVHEDLARDAREIWLWNWDERRTVFELPVTEQPALAFAARDQRLIVHGGGWGLGGYQEARAKLVGTGWAADVVVHDRGEVPGDWRGSADRYFMIDPAWRTWHRGPDGHTFPPFAEVDAAPAGVAEHALFQLIRRSKAIVSKPGGGTLIDSLASATPVILLEPFGYAEERNGALWEQLGFGISFARWYQDGCRDEVLERLHQNLRQRTRNGPDYPADYLARMT